MAIEYEVTVPCGKKVVLDSDNTIANYVEYDNCSNCCLYFYNDEIKNVPKVASDNCKLHLGKRIDISIRKL